MRKWVTYHGVAINYDPDLNKFKSIIPCGISDDNFSVTSIKNLNKDITKQDFDFILKEEFQKIFS